MLDPPWWLLLDVPEMWSSGIDDWRKVYDIRLKTQMSAMKQDEESMGGSNYPPIHCLHICERAGNLAGSSLIMLRERARRLILFSRSS